MIIVRLKGGFANQLFQFATAKKLAKLNETDVLFDLTYLKKAPKGAYTQRDFELDQTKVPIKIATENELRNFELSGFFKRGMNKLGLGKYLTLYETSSNDPKKLETLRGNYLLDGYWQNELYFNSIRIELLELIQASYSFTDKGKELDNVIRNSNSVAIHVRRGDYVELKHANEFHGICSIDYYRKAVSYLKEKYNGLSFYVFSDDIAWCKKELSFINDVVLVEEESAKNSSQDLFLMSRCKHFIIANSSYSWWAAWLSVNHTKTVIAPEKWFNDATIDTSSLIPKSWIRI